MSAINEAAGRIVSNVVADALPSAAEVEVGGARLLSASVDDALGYASDPRVREVVTSTVRRQSLLAPASSRLVADLCQRLADWGGAPACALVAHPAVAFAALAPTHVDARLARRAHFAGPRVAVPEELPDGAEHGRLWIEASHPLEGDLFPLHRLVDRTARTAAQLIVSDELGLGVLGQRGAGVVEHFQLEPSGLIRVQRLAGALGVPGWAVLGTREQLATLDGGAPHAWPSASLAAGAKALELCGQEPHRRVRLLELTDRLQRGLAELGCDAGPSVTHLVPVWLGEESLAQRYLAALAEAGVSVRAWLEPSRSRLLLSLSATTTDAQLERLLAALGGCVKKLGLPELPPTATDFAVARPGSFAVARACGPWWRDEPPSPPPADVPPPAAAQAAAELRAKLGEAVESLTWRVANTRIPNIKDVVDPALIRAVLDRVRRR